VSTSYAGENALLIKKATVIQITTRYNQGLQKSISEHTTCQTLKQMGYSMVVLLLSAKNRKLRLQFAPAHQNWTIEDWKNVACTESQFWLKRKMRKKNKKNEKA